MSELQDSEEQNIPDQLGDAAIFVGRIGSREVVEIKNLDIVTGPDGSIGINAAMLARLLEGVGHDVIVWLRPPPYSRSGHDKEKNEITLLGGRILIDVDRNELVVNGEPIRITRMQFQILDLLARNSGRIISRDQFANEIWGGYLGSRTVEVHIKKLRDLLGEYSPIIQTRHKLGYMLDERFFPEDKHTSNEQ